MPLIDPGLQVAGGIGQGLMQGVNSFMQARKMNQDNDLANKKFGLLQQHQQNEEAFQKQRLGLMGAQSGYNYDEGSQSYQPTQLTQANQDAALTEANLKNQTGQYSLDTANAMHDSDSDASKAARGTASAYIDALKKNPTYAKNPGAFSGFEDTLSNGSAADIDNLLGNKTFQEAVKYGTTQQEIAAKRAQFAHEWGVKNDKMIDDLSGKMQKDLDPDAGRTGNFGQISQKHIQAQKLKKLATEANGDIRNLNGPEQEDLALGMYQMISGGGSSAQGSVRNLVPHSALGSYNDFKAYLLNMPQGRDQQAFTQRMMDNVNRESDLAAQQMKEIQVRRLGSHSTLKKMAPTQYQSILDNYGITDRDTKSGGLINPQGLKPDQRAAIIKALSGGRNPQSVTDETGEEDNAGSESL